MNKSSVFLALTLFACIGLSIATTGDSCANADVINLPATIPADGHRVTAKTIISSGGDLTTFQSEVSFYLVASDSACSPAQYTGGYFIKVVPASTGRLYVALTSATWNEQTDFPAVYTISQATTNSCPTSTTIADESNKYKCLVNAAKNSDDICQGYNVGTSPTSFDVTSGKPFYITVFRKFVNPAATGTTFEVVIRSSVTVTSENFSSFSSSLAAGKKRKTIYYINLFYRMDKGSRN